MAGIITVPAVDRLDDVGVDFDCANGFLIGSKRRENVTAAPRTDHQHVSVWPDGKGRILHVAFQILYRLQIAFEFEQGRFRGRVNPQQPVRNNKALNES